MPTTIQEVGSIGRGVGRLHGIALGDFAAQVVQAQPSTVTTATQAAQVANGLSKQAADLSARASSLSRQSQSAMRSGDNANAGKLLVNSLLAKRKAILANTKAQGAAALTQALAKHEQMGRQIIALKDRAAKAQAAGNASLAADAEAQANLIAQQQQAAASAAASIKSAMNSEPALPPELNETNLVQLGAKYNVRVTKRIARQQGNRPLLVAVLGDIDTESDAARNDSPVTAMSEYGGGTMGTTLAAGEYGNVAVFLQGVKALGALGDAIWNKSSGQDPTWLKVVARVRDPRQPDIETISVHGDETAPYDTPGMGSQSSADRYREVVASIQQATGGQPDSQAEILFWANSKWSGSAQRPSASMVANIKAARARRAAGGDYIDPADFGDRGIAATFANFVKQKTGIDISPATSAASAAAKTALTQSASTMVPRFGPVSQQPGMQITPGSSSAGAGQPTPPATNNGTQTTIMQNPMSVQPPYAGSQTQQQQQTFTGPQSSPLMQWLGTPTGTAVAVAGGLTAAYVLYRTLN